ncbi:hypothetical protein BX616_008619, partial [Lobosporangium transversale]
PTAPTPPALFINGNSSLGKTSVVKAILSTVLGDTSPSHYAFLDCIECHTPRLIFEHAIYQFRHPPSVRWRYPADLHSQQQADQIMDGYAHAQHTAEADQSGSGSSRSSSNEDGSSPSQDPQMSDGSGRKDIDTGTTLVKNGEGRRKRKWIQDEIITSGPPTWDKCENINEFVEWCRRICADGNDGQGHASIHAKGSAYSEEQRQRKGQHDTRYLVLDRAERLRDNAPTLIPVLMRLQEL